MSPNPPGASWRLHYPCAFSPLLDGLSAVQLRVYFYLASAGYLPVTIQARGGASLLRRSVGTWRGAVRALEERGLVRRVATYGADGAQLANRLQAIRLEAVQQ